MSFISDNEHVYFENKVLKDIGEASDSNDAVSLKKVQSVIDDKLKVFNNDQAHIQKVIEEAENFDKKMTEAILKLENKVRKETAQANHVENGKTVRTVRDIIYKIQDRLKLETDAVNTKCENLDGKLKIMDFNWDNRLDDISNGITRFKVQLAKDLKFITDDIEYLKNHVHSLLGNQPTP